MYGHRDPPGSLPSGVQQAERHIHLRGRHGGRRQLHAGAVVYAKQWLEKETKDFSKVVLNLHTYQNVLADTKPSNSLAKLL